MTEFDNTNRGSIWPNDKKTTDNHPDFTGSLNVDGKEYWVSAWKRKPDANPKAPSLKFSIQEKVDNMVKPAPAGTPTSNNDFDSDIPF